MPLMLSLDPGGTTGVSIIGYDTDSVYVVRTEQVLNGLEGFVHWVKEVSLSQFDEIVCESFTLRPGVHGADITPAYVIGALEAIVHGERKVIYQQPSQKKLCGDDKLKKMEMYEAGSPHANDATRHGIIYLRNKIHLPTLEKGWK